MSALNHLLGKSPLSVPDTHNFTTLPHDLPLGENNKFIRSLSYSFSMSDPNTAILKITDSDEERYSINKDVTHKSKPDTTMRTEMLGFKLFRDPFSF